jgi:excisionase family DNA binding protein
MDKDILLTPQDAAELLALSKSWLAKLRMNGDGPAFVKLGRRVRYRLSDLQAWTNGAVYRSTSDADVKSRSKPRPEHHDDLTTKRVEVG